MLDDPGPRETVADGGRVYEGSGAPRDLGAQAVSNRRATAPNRGDQHRRWDHQSEDDARSAPSVSAAIMSRPQQVPMQPAGDDPHDIVSLLDGSASSPSPSTAPTAPSGGSRSPRKRSSAPSPHGPEDQREVRKTRPVWPRCPSDAAATVRPGDDVVVTAPFRWGSSASVGQRPAAGTATAPVPPPTSMAHCALIGCPDGTGRTPAPRSGARSAGHGSRTRIARDHHR